MLQFAKGTPGRLFLSIGCWILTGICFPRLGTAQEGAKPYVSQVWSADLGNGSYKNPILHADYSDPDVIRVGADYYMTASSFNCTPGLPILHSRDLVNWSLVNYALQALTPDSVFRVPQHGNGVWAPCMRYRNGMFYIYWGDPDFGVYVVRTHDPLGKWEEPVLVLPGKGIIDPSPLWDDDGKVYLVHAWAASRAGVNSLLTVRRMNAEGIAVIDEGKHVFDGHDAHPTLEGPKFYKRNGYYYILAPAGGVATGWQLALRSRDVYGPYEEKIVLEQGTMPTNGPHQGAWVDTPFGEDWFIHFQDKKPYGRILHLQPVQWSNDWPLMGVDVDKNGIGEPVLQYRKPKVAGVVAKATPQENDEFNSDTLGIQWQWNANTRVTWSALLRGKGYLRLFPTNMPAQARNLWDVPNFLLQKFPAPTFQATTKVTWTIERNSWQERKAGLLISGNDYAYLAVAQDSLGYKVIQVKCMKAESGSPEEIVEVRRIASGTVFLRVGVAAPNGSCQFSYSEDGKVFTTIGQPFLAQPEKWIGAKVGLFASAGATVKHGGYADFDWFWIERGQ